jgi:hypothetical protein
MKMKIIITFFVITCSIGLIASPNDAFANVTFVDTFDVPSPVSKITDVTFNSDGTKMFVVGTDYDKIYEYPCTTGFDVSTCNTAGASNFSVKNGDNLPQGITFNTDGTKLFVIGSVRNDVFEYSCTTGFDISTCGATQIATEDTTAQDTSSMDLAFNSDGTKMFVLGDAGNDVNEYTLSVGFDLSSTVNFIDSFELSGLDETNEYLKGLAFNTDGTKLFVIGQTSDKVYEYPCTTGFDVSTCDGAEVSSFDVSGEETSPTGLEFNSDGTKMFVTGTTGAGDDAVHEYTLSVGVDLSVPAEEAATKKKSSSDCYDCEAPKLTKVEVHVSSSPFDYVWHFDQKSPYPMFGDDITPIIADPGDEVEIILELTDNRTLERVYDSGTYTNFLTKPDDMNTFYANNFDEYGKVSTTYYEWHQTGEDLVYDYDNTVEWSDADVTIEESGEFAKDGPAENLDGLVGTFTISFKMKFLQPMQTSDVYVQATDRSGNFFKVALPLTLKVSGNEPLVFESKVNQKVLSFYDEDILSEVVSDWNGSSQDVSELAAILGIPDEQLDPWVANLAVWVSEDRITVADMIVAIEYLINN